MAIRVGDMYFKTYRYMAKGSVVTSIFDKETHTNFIVNGQEFLGLKSRDEIEIYADSLNEDHTIYLIMLSDYCGEVMPGLIFLHKDGLDKDSDMRL